MELQSTRVATFLMFTGQAEQAMSFYVSLIPGSQVQSVKKYGPGGSGVEGSVELAHFTLGGQAFMCIDSAVKHAFTFTPSMSIFVTCQSEEEVDRLYAQLVEGGTAMMPLGAYGFSRKFGWVQDRFGVSWQLNLP
jgi:predicted 3-demethylubiquinone-9 3-methyltransferase (glyoxalase superfamily)